eukprot:Anaeramoba_flamelloidesc41294_g1_i2.p1 GENE.c41294_g1_i2~~c41294_g1_i2.p1  ORF type:complete len:108 (-),score=18.47 c41294_g1_i2:20-343(-)
MSRFKKLFKKNKEEKFGTYIDTSTLEPIPPENELFGMFERLMTELGITNLKKQTMRKMTNKRKWLLLCQHKSKEELRVTITFLNNNCFFYLFSPSSFHKELVLFKKN